MTTNNLVKDILNGVIRAQYESYQHSRKIGEQDFKLLPIPYAEIAEITLDLKFAYLNVPGEETVYEELDLVEIYTQLEPFLNQTLAKVLRHLVEMVDNRSHTSDEEWGQIKENLLQGKLNNYILGDFKSRFISGLGKSIKKNSLSDYYKITESLLGNLLIQSIQAKLIIHSDFATHLEKLNEQRIKDIFKDIHAEFENNKIFLTETFNACTTNRNRETEIVVDAEALSKMPADAVQHLKLSLNLKNMIRENNNT